MSDNPFAAPEYLDGGAEFTGEGIIAVEGKRIVCTSPVTLPRLCVKTGSEMDLVEVRKTIHWCPSWVWLTLLLNLIVLLICYFVTRKQISVVFWVERSVRARHRVNTFIGVLIFLAGIVGLFPAVSGESPVLIVGCIVGIIAGLVMAVIFSNLISVAAHKKGMFHLKGFGMEYLDAVDEIRYAES